MVTSACSDYFKYPFLLHNHLTCRSVLHADNVHTLLWLVHTFSIKGEYRGIVLSIAHYLVNARWIYFNDFLEFCGFLHQWVKLCEGQRINFDYLASSSELGCDIAGKKS